MKVSVRPWINGDEIDLVTQANNVKIFNNVRDLFPHPYTINDGIKWIKSNLDIIPAKNMAILVDDKIAGSIGLKLQEDVYRKNAEVGYFLGEQYWGKGLTTIALKKFIEYTFNTFPVTRLFAPIFEYNIASIKVLEKNGFKREGYFKKSIYKNGEYFNEVILAQLKEDFKS